MAAANHNRRTDYAMRGSPANIDPRRTPLNETLLGPDTAAGIVAKAKQLKLNAGIKLDRVNGVRCLELLFSLPAQHEVDERDFFSDCLAWTAVNFGGMVNVLSADIHRDESSPHCHILILPLLNGRMNAAKLVGDRFRLKALHADFQKAVASQHGLKPAQEKLSPSAKKDAASRCIKVLMEKQDAAIRSAVWPELRMLIEANPARMAGALGIDLAQAAPTKKLRTVVQIFTSSGKGKSYEPLSIENFAPESSDSLALCRELNPAGCLSAD